MPFLLLIFFGLYGWIEFEVFIVIGNTVGGLVTFLGIFATALIGVTLMKRQGVSVMQRWQAGVIKGKIHTSTLAIGISLMLGAVLMLLPGYVTDFAGILCFIPGLRVFIGRRIFSWLGGAVISSGLASGFSKRFEATGAFSPSKQTNSEPYRPQPYARHQPLGGDIIEGQFESKDEPQK